MGGIRNETLLKLKAFLNSVQHPVEGGSQLRHFIMAWRHLHTGTQVADLNGFGCSNKIPERPEGPLYTDVNNQHNQ